MSFNSVRGTTAPSAACCSVRFFADLVVMTAAQVAIHLERRLDAPRFIKAVEAHREIAREVELAEVNARDGMSCAGSNATTHAMTPSARLCLQRPLRGWRTVDALGTLTQAALSFCRPARP